MAKTLVRNAILDGKVVRKGTEVEDDVAARIDPAAFGQSRSAVDEIAAPGPVEVRYVDEAPLLDALRQYAAGRGLDGEDLDGLEILDALVDADEAVAANLEAAEVDNGQDAGDAEAKRIAEVLEGDLDEVNGHLEAHPEDVEAVLAAEAAGKNRKGIVHGPHGTKQE